MGRKLGAPHPPGCKHCTPEWRAKISAIRKGRGGRTGPQSDATKARIGVALSGERNPMWIDASYGKAHRQVIAAKGRAVEHVCACGRQAQEWAYNHAAASQDLVVEAGRFVGRHYSMNIEDYIAMCKKCHRAFDWHWSRA